MEADRQFKALSRLSCSQCPRFGTRRSAWPTSAWFDSRLAIGRQAPLVDFIGGLTAERHVRSLCEVRDYVEQKGLFCRFSEEKAVHAAHNSLLAWEPRSSSHHPPSPPKRLLHYPFSGCFSSVVARTAPGDKSRDVATSRPNYVKLFHGIMPAKFTDTGTSGEPGGACAAQLHRFPYRDRNGPRPVQQRV